MERRKYLGRYEHEFIKNIESKIVRIEEIDIAGYVSLVQILEVYQPRVVGGIGSEVCIADNGYSELVYLPDNENWQLCAIYDNHDNIIEWYFDISRKNGIDENGSPYCDDLYLDAALLPNGRILVFDEDEIKNALSNGKITQNDFNLAYNVLDKLRESGILTVAYMESLCKKLKLLFDS